MSGSMSDYSIGNTPPAEANQLQWIKIVDGSKTLLICDRNILVNVSWDDLNGVGWVKGKKITIDGAEYNLRLMTGGSNYRSGSDAYSGGQPTNNEWDRFVTREEVIEGLPAPTSSDLDTTQNATDLNGASNKLWNWYYCYSWVQETYSGSSSDRARRGYFSARYWYYNSSSNRNSFIGFRPVLEVLNSAPVISDTDRSLGDKNADFTIDYTVDDTDAADVLSATETIDTRTVRTYAPTRKTNNRITVTVKELALGPHTVKVVVTDGKGGSATRTWTFTRTNAAPAITGTDTNLGDKNLGFSYQYQVTDADNDEVTVVEKLNEETLRTMNNAPKGQQLTVEISAEKLYTLPLNSVNTITITATDGQGGTTYRRLTFKRTNSAPTITGQDQDVGKQTGSFSETYTVNDAEGDNVVVTEFVDDTQIRTFKATLGNEETITLDREKWLALPNGAHRLRVEAVDGNFATSVRVWNFSKEETVISFTLAEAEETDAAATKILVSPTWSIEGASVKVEACNNAFDDVPTWEDITAMVQLNRVFNFTNQTKTGDRWGVNIRFTITKNPGYPGEVSISGFGGAYE